VITLRPGREQLDAGQRRQIADVLARGLLIVYPTDTLYALGGRARDPRAAAAVRQAKGRPPDKALPVVAADVEQAGLLCDLREGCAARLAERFWPGPLTLVLRAVVKLPEELSEGGATLAVRVPSRELTRELCRLAGPLIATSANRSGRPAAATCREALEEIGGAVALAVDGGAGGGPPSTLVDLTGPSPRLLREGAIPWSDVAAILEPSGRGGS
jgi:tRNA threonylcarbamoyl adenosine modification protein (Sua5/YciO/YrdC/YwlC family)